MKIGFAEALAIGGALLIGAATASGLVRRSVLSVTVLASLAGAILGWTGLLSIDPRGPALIAIVELVLLVTLFADGMQVEQGLARRLWRAPARALAVAMPVNAALLALAAKLLLPELTWFEAFLLGFLLSPTDPVITSSVVASQHVPAPVRHILNLESGLNDGLALPFVLLFLALAEGAPSVASEAADLALESAIGLAIGILLALLAGRLLDLLPAWAITRRYEGLYALGLGLAAFGVAELVDGNGLIAAFLAGMALAIQRREMPDVFLHFNEDLGALLQLIAFVLFGALVVATDFDVAALPLVAFVAFALAVARPLSIWIAFAGVGLSRPEKAFVAWFGPKGIASMLFALFVLHSTVDDRALVFEVAAATILASIVLHGLTDTVGAQWIERRLQGAEGGRARV